MTEALGYTSDCLTWSLIGFFIGAGVNQLVTVQPATGGHTPFRLYHQPKGRRMNRRSVVEKIKGWDRTRVLGILLLVLALFTSVTAAIQQRAQGRLSDRQAQFVACLTGYSNGFADALDARTKAQADAQAALDDLIDAIAEDPQSFNSALKKYRDARDKQTESTIDNPYPPAPREVCQLR